MTEMVYGTVRTRTGEPILPRWWRTVDRWTIVCIFALFGIGLLLGLAASAPLAEKHSFAPTHYVERQALFGAMGLTPDTPLAALWTWGRAMRFLDGPDEVHLRTVARDELGKARDQRGHTAAYFTL